MPIEKLRPSFTFTEDRLKELQAVVPEAFADGKINWDVLREALGEYLEDPAQEHFGLTWPGKREARRLASLLSKGTLVPQPGEGVNEDNTQNIFIEGDNLEVLKLLLKSYAGRVKMIYIDPPYNRDGDYIYEDDYSEPLEVYLQRTGQMDESGRLLNSNARTSGRFHSKWLSMMYPRLLLARQLLHMDGVIFISIDDNEVHHLRMIMDEVFGAENFISQFVWEKTQHFGRQAINSYNNVDYILVYSKSIINDKGNKAYRLVERIKTELEDAPLYNASNPLAEITFPSFSTQFNIPDGLYDSTTDSTYELLTPVLVEKGTNTNEFILRFRSRWSAAKVLEEYTRGTRYWVKSKNFAIRTIYPDDRKSIESPRQLIFSNKNNPLVSVNRMGEKVGTSEEATAELKDILQVDIEMYPKPKSLLSYLISIIFDDERNVFSTNGIIMDFFAGSCTTAHAVLQQNREDGGNRQFIMVQLPEPTPPDSAARQAGYATIAEIGKERIRRVIRKLQEEKNGQLPLPEGEQAAAPEDLGFRVLKLDRSHFVEWQSDVQDVSQLGLRFVQAESPLVANWEPQNLLTEILLLQGFPLDSRVIPLDSIQSNHIQRVHSDSCDHDLFVCLDTEIHPDTIPHLHLRDQDVFICLDAALTDQLKVQLADTCNLKVI